jgi:amino-acid N-acetyltransferase
LNNVIIRKAVTGDVAVIHSILKRYGEEGLLLPRSLSELYDHLRDFFILEDQGQEATILGIGALAVCWEDLAEIRSLAVVPERQGRHYGLRLVESCLEEAKSLGLRKVFTLTYVPGFFARLGFKEVDKSVLPHKVWAECLKCPKFPGCDEIAMLVEL